MIFVSYAYKANGEVLFGNCCVDFGGICNMDDVEVIEQRTLEMLVLDGVPTSEVTVLGWRKFDGE